MHKMLINKLIWFILRILAHITHFYKITGSSILISFKDWKKSSKIRVCRVFCNFLQFVNTIIAIALVVFDRF